MAGDKKYHLTDEDIEFIKNPQNSATDIINRFGCGKATVNEVCSEMADLPKFGLSFFGVEQFL